MSLKNKTFFITGASRGIGLAIALRAARDGANVVVAAKTDQPHPKLEGTIHTAVEAIEEAGGKGLAVVCDVRDEASVKQAVEAGAEHFGGIDVCVNNASAIQLTTIEETPMRRFDLMHQVGPRAAYMVAKYTLERMNVTDDASGCPHMLFMSPPLDLQPKWFARHTAYSMAKFGMSMCALGLSAELKGRVAVNALWPRTSIDTAAVRNLLGGEAMALASRTPAILADAAHAILTKPVDFTGNFLIDDTFLAEHGVTDFSGYRVDPTKKLFEDFFVPADVPAPETLDAIA